MSTQIKNAKYRIKDENGNYQIVHFETNVGQVEGLTEALTEAHDLINDRYTKSEVDGSFRAVETEISEVEAIAEGLNGRLTIAESNIVSLNEGLASESERAQGVEADLQAQINGLDASIEAINHPESGILKQSKDYTDEKVKDLTDGVIKDLENSLGSSSSELTGKIEALEGVVASNKSETDAAIEVANGRLTAVTSRVDVAETAIEDLRGADAELAEEIKSIKDVIAGQGSDTKVFETFEEFVAYAETAIPKIGDLVHVVNIKKSFLYKGEPGKAVKGLDIPKNWILFDELTTEIDLHSYVKRSEVEAHVASLEGKITSEQERAMAAEKALADSIASVQGNVDTHGERITALEGVTATHTSEINTLKETTYNKEQVDAIVDTEVTLAMNVMSTSQPTEDEKRRVGHVWIELI